MGDISSPFKQHEEKSPKNVFYIRDHRGQHVWYSLKYFTCEFLNFVNVIGQMFLMDRYRCLSDWPDLVHAYCILQMVRLIDYTSLKLWKK